ncbi:MAG: 4-hydroxy-3-methylbut-2-enyl diphosphate reductase, partial [Candidatus Latescibacteria bacterium]|nr:4-hydroxy-3-methylbut-2-enyl diphosphate reductase [Candidatus Latescibacterota bacterium]
MKVRIAESAGFCMGVRKAMDSVLEASRGTAVTYTLGPLIHNPQAIRMLESRNVYVTEDIGESLRGRTVVIRAHGITRQKREQLEHIGARIVDATCPKVLRSERLLRKYFEKGYNIVIVGDRGHAEIDALMSYTDGKGVVVETVEEAKNLPRMDKVCVIAQTTFNRDVYEDIAAEIRACADDCKVAKTICRSTERRQADVRKLAELTDATVVVGGRNSANTRRLAEISRNMGQPTFHIEDPAELDLEELSRYDEIGITAGASTPNWVIKQVYDAVAGYTPETRRSPHSLLMSLAFFAIEGNFVLCAGSVALTFAVSALMGLAIAPALVFMPFFYLFPLHAVNKYLEINWEQFARSKQAARLRRYWRIYLGTGFISFLVTLGIAWRFGALTFGLTVVSYLLGLLYSVRIVPVSWQTRFKSLRDIPGSKDLFIAAAWTFSV